MTSMEVVILGAGPCGLASAIALSKISTTENPLHITLVELRPTLQTIGGIVNLTPLAARYLEYLGVGARLQERCFPLDTGVDYISLRTGKIMANFWGGIGGVRIGRLELVHSLLETILENHGSSVQIEWGRRVTEIRETKDKVVLDFNDERGDLAGDMLLGCDGLYSSARRLWVEPERKATFIERVVAMGWLPEAREGSESPIWLSNGQPALRNTSLIRTGKGIFLASYYEPTRTKVFLANILSMEEPEDGNSKTVWKVLGSDQDSVKRRIAENYRNGRIRGLEELIDSCDSWQLYPIYILPGKGQWRRGRVLLLGDAAHSVGPSSSSSCCRRWVESKIIDNPFRCPLRVRAPDCR